MKVEIFPAFCVIEGYGAELVAALDKAFSFTDQSVKYEITRFKRMCAAKEKAGQVFLNWANWKKAKLADLESKILVKVHDIENGVLIVPMGLYEDLVGIFKELGLAPEIIDLRNLEPERKILQKGKSELTLRYYQKEALEKALQRQDGLIEIVTGGGKTAIAQELIAKRKCRSIFLAPTEPIMSQTYHRFVAAFGKDNVGIFGDGKKNHRWVTVATYQGVYASKNDPKFKDYDMALYDECHRVASETFYFVNQNILTGASYRYGLSATPDRLDGGRILVHAGVGPTIYEYTAKQGIEDGFLAKPSFQVYDVLNTRGSFEVVVKDEIEVVEVENKSHYNSLQDYKHWVMGNEILNNFVMSLSQILTQDEKSILILVDEKQHGNKLANLAKSMGLDHRYVMGGSNDLEDSLRVFNKRQMKLLIGTSVLGEGTDTVPVDILINLMGGKTPKQAIGRALRNEDGKKMTTLIIDFNFPKVKTLRSHFEAREKVYGEYGEIEKSILPTI